MFLKKLLPSLRGMLIFFAAAAAAMLGVALIAQYGFDLHPCELCMLQRYPYAAIVALGLCGAIGIKNPKIVWLLAILCWLLLVADAGIAFYHTGVELGWFPGPSACTSHDTPGETLEQMRAEIMNAALVPCNQPMARLLGISMAGWNAIGATLLAGITASALAVIARRTKSDEAIHNNNR